MVFSELDTLFEKLSNKFTLIISDLHLSDDRVDLIQAFETFCSEYASKAEALYILGDLFDAWLGDDDDSQTAQITRKLLKDLSDNGTQVFFMQGNRDFLVGEKFARATDMTLLKQPIKRSIYNHEYLLLHGDTLCTQDINYMKFRRRIQNPVTKFVLSHLPFKLRKKIANKIKKQSHSEKLDKTAMIMDVTTSEVDRIMRLFSVDTMIHGHTHRPKIHTLPDRKAKRYVLGDWDKTGWCIALDHNQIELLSFELS